MTDFSHFQVFHIDFESSRKNIDSVFLPLSKDASFPIKNFDLFWFINCVGIFLHNNFFGSGSCYKRVVENCFIILFYWNQLRPLLWFNKICKHLPLNAIIFIRLKCITWNKCECLSHLIWNVGVAVAIAKFWKFLHLEATMHLIAMSHKQRIKSASYIVFIWFWIKIFFFFWIVQKTCCLPLLTDVTFSARYPLIITCGVAKVKSPLKNKNIPRTCFWKLLSS